MRLDLFIAGERRPPVSGRYETVKGPVSEEALGEVAVADVEDVAAGAAAALRAFDAGIPPAYERASWLRRAAQGVSRDAERLSTALMGEIGKTTKEARAEVAGAVRALEYLADEALRVTGETIRDDVGPGSAGTWIFTRREPAGPVCAITAFNAPLSQGVHKVGAALAAGCPVVLKPSPYTPFTTSLFVDILAESGIPSGWINLVFGGVEVGQALFGSQCFARYTFTGSRRVGLELIRAVGLRPAILEMGSNAPNIVHRDAQLDAAIRSLMDGAFATAGQTCIRPQRILVHDEIYTDFVEAFTSKVRHLKVGDPRKPETDVGPMRTEEAARRVVEWVENAVDAGAQLLVGGHRDGVYMEPTVLCDVPPDQKVVCEEVFGPVVVLQSFASLDEAVAIANDSPYGLQAGVFTQDLATCMNLISKLRVGGVMINSSSRLRIPHVPFGGVKDSGWGREGGRWGVEEFTDIKTVVIRM